MVAWSKAFFFCGRLMVTWATPETSACMSTTSVSASGAGTSTSGSEVRLGSSGGSRGVTSDLGSLRQMGHADNAAAAAAPPWAASSHRRRGPLHPEYAERRLG